MKAMNDTTCKSFDAAAELRFGRMLNIYIESTTLSLNREPYSQGSEVIK